MSEINDFLDVEPDSRGTEGGEGVRYPGDSKSVTLHRHKLTAGQWDGMYVAQSGCCAICCKHQSKLKRRLVVDHDHVTGKIRGLLCGKCNTVLGMAEDNPKTLAWAIEYLKGTE